VFPLMFFFFFPPDDTATSRRRGRGGEQAENPRGDTTNARPGRRAGWRKQNKKHRAETSAFRESGRLSGRRRWTPAGMTRPVVVGRATGNLGKERTGSGPDKLCGGESEAERTTRVVAGGFVDLGDDDVRTFTYVIPPRRVSPGLPSLSPQRTGAGLETDMRVPASRRGTARGIAVGPDGRPGID
jgi:hypothetical protein